MKIEDKIEFISYDGEYPNLCSGLLKLRINDKEYSFGRTCLTDNCGDYPQFWASGGAAGVNSETWEEYCLGGDWYWDMWYKAENETRYFPDVVLRNKDKIMEIFNDNVPHGCCGGCI